MKNSPLHALQTAAKDYPNKTAIAYLDEKAGLIEISYKDFYNKVQCLAGWLQAKGVKAGNIVSVFLDDGPEYVIAAHAIWQLDASYMPMPTDPVQQTLDNINRANAPFVLTNENNVQTLSNAGVKARSLNYPANLDINMGDDTPQFCDENLEKAAYIFSSCNKQVLVKNSLAGIPGRATSAARISNITDEDIILGYFSRSFDASLFNIFLTTYTAATLLLIPTEIRQNPVGELSNYLYQAQLKSYQPSFTVIPPSVLALLAPKDFPSLKHIQVAGEACNPQKLQAWLEAGCSMTNGYGVKEASIAATITSFGAQQEPAISQTLDGVDLWIQPKESKEMFPYHVNDEQIEYKKDIVGELVISGEGVGEYLLADEMQHQRFFFNGEDRYFKTGDKVSWTQENLTYEGRYDRRINRAGQLVDLDKIKEMLESITDEHGNKLVNQATIIALPRKDNRPAVTAFIHFLDDRWKKETEVLQEFNFDIFTHKRSATYLDALSRIDARYRPDFSYYIDKRLSGENKELHNFDAIWAAKPTPIVKSNIHYDDSELAHDIYTLWCSIAMPKRLIEERAMPRYMNTKLDFICGDSITRSRFADQLNKKYTDQIKEPIIKKVLTQTINKLAANSATLRTFVQVIYAHYSYLYYSLATPFTPIDLSTKLPKEYLGDPALWIDVHICILSNINPNSIYIRLDPNKYTNSNLDHILRKKELGRFLKVTGKDSIHIFLTSNSFFSEDFFYAKLKMFLENNQHLNIALYTIGEYSNNTYFSIKNYRKTFYILIPNIRKKIHIPKSLEDKLNKQIARPLRAVTNCYLPAIFFLPPLTGDVPGVYWLIAKELPKGHPVYAFHSIVRFDSLEHQVDVFTKAIQRIEPQRPCILIGYSYGGMLVNGVAAKLESENQPPALVINIDGVPPMRLLEMSQSQKAVRQLIYHFIASFNLSTHFNKEGFDAHTQAMTIENNDELLALFSIALTYCTPSDTEKANQRISRLKNTFDQAKKQLMLLQAATQYLQAFPPHHIDTLTIIASETVKGLTDHTNFKEWPKYTGKNKEIKITGNHFSLFFNTELNSAICDSISQLSSDSRGDQAAAATPSKTSHC